MEAKLSEQQAIHSAEFDSLQKKYDAALDDAREQSAAARAELLRQAQAREEALLAQLGQQSGLGAPRLRVPPVARLRRSEALARACRAGGGGGAVQRSLDGSAPPPERILGVCGGEAEKAASERLDAERARFVPTRRRHSVRRRSSRNR